MLIRSISRIFFFSVISAAVLMIVNFAHATTSALDSALNNSLQESRAINQEMDHNLSARPQNEVTPKIRQKVEINLDEADAKDAATYKKVQANGDLKESSY